MSCQTPVKLGKCQDSTSKACSPIEDWSQVLITSQAIDRCYLRTEGLQNFGSRFRFQVTVLPPEGLYLLDEVGRQKPEGLLEVAHVDVVGDQHVLDLSPTVGTAEKDATHLNPNPWDCEFQRSNCVEAE